MTASTETRALYRHWLTIPTRWMDNDLYGHVNNVVYYSYFDTLVNRFLIDAGFDIHRDEVIGVAVESQCRFHKPIAFPEVVDGGLRVGRLGRTSVRYEIGLFRQGEADAAAEGYFVHVFVGRDHRAPMPIPDKLVRELARIQGPARSGSNVSR